MKKLLALVFGDQASQQDIIDYLLVDPDTLALIFAYLVKYMDVYDLSAADIDKLLEALGINKLNEMLTLFDFSVFGVHVDVNLNLANILNYLKGKLSDGKRNPLFKKVIKYFFKVFWVNIDGEKFGERLRKKSTLWETLIQQLQKVMQNLRRELFAIFQKVRMML